MHVPASHEQQQARAPAVQHPTPACLACTMATCSTTSAPRMAWKVVARLSPSQARLESRILRAFSWLKSCVRGGEGGAAGQGKKVAAKARLEGPRTLRVSGWWKSRRV